MSADRRPRLIVNADDFGLSPGVSRGIVEAFRDGILTSTTTLVNLDHFDDAVELARANPELPLGIHLSLLWGPPVADPSLVPSLLDRDGNFPRSLGVLARRYFTGALSLQQVRLEMERQIRKFLDSGCIPTHVDTHKHIHCLPGVLDCVISVAGEFGIDKVRIPVESAIAPGLPRAPWQARAKRDLIRYLCRDGRNRVQAAGMRTTDHFMGIEHMACLNAQTLGLMVDNLEDGVTELMCHPGRSDSAARRYSKTPPHREVELAGLCDPTVRERLVRAGVQLTSYRDL